MLSRRSFLQLAGFETASLEAARVRAAEAALRALGPATPAYIATASSAQADYTLRIAPLSLELAPGVFVETTAFNGTVPGPILRLKEGVPATIDVFDNSARMDPIHWHGLAIESPSGAWTDRAEIEPVRYCFTPAPSGARWHHTQASPGTGANAGADTGASGLLYVEPKSNPGAYDLEVFLAIHHWEPRITQRTSPRAGYQAVYRYASFNGRLATASEPIRVRQGQRAIFRLLNASATEEVTLALPGHEFEVVALDGNPVPVRKKTSTLSLGVGERIDAMVQMTNPGVWMLGSVDDAERAIGLGAVVEYAGSSGPAVWTAPPSRDWSYELFADPIPRNYAPERTIPMVFSVVRGEDGRTGQCTDRWTINGQMFPENPAIEVQRGKRYRLALMNASAEAHTMHLQRHSFEIVSIAGQPMSGLRKDTLQIGPWKKIEVDFVADNPGDTLLHSQQQPGMESGLIQRIEYVPTGQIEKTS